MMTNFKFLFVVCFPLQVKDSVWTDLKLEERTAKVVRYTPEPECKYPTPIIVQTLIEDLHLKVAGDEKDDDDDSSDDDDDKNKQEKKEKMADIKNVAVTSANITLAEIEESSGVGKLQRLHSRMTRNHQKALKAAQAKCPPVVVVVAAVKKKSQSGPKKSEREIVREATLREVAAAEKLVRDQNRRELGLRVSPPPVDSNSIKLFSALDPEESFESPPPPNFGRIYRIGGRTLKAPDDWGRAKANLAASLSLTVGHPVYQITDRRIVYHPPLEVEKEIEKADKDEDEDEEKKKKKKAEVEDEVEGEEEEENFDFVYRVLYWHESHALCDEDGRQTAAGSILTGLDPQIAPCSRWLTGRHLFALRYQALVERWEREFRDAQYAKLLSCSVVDEEEEAEAAKADRLLPATRPLLHRIDEQLVLGNYERIHQLLAENWSRQAIEKLLRRLHYSGTAVDFFYAAIGAVIDLPPIGTEKAEVLAQKLVGLCSDAFFGKSQSTGGGYHEVTVAFEELYYLGGGRSSSLQRREEKGYLLVLSKSKSRSLPQDILVLEVSYH